MPDMTFGYIMVRGAAVCASTWCRGVYYLISWSAICKIARKLKNICREGKYQALARRRSASQLSVRSFPQFTTRNADTATLPHWPATPAPYPPPHSDRTGEPGCIHLYRIPSFNLMFILPVPSPVLVRPTCRLLWCPEARAFWQIYLYHLFGNFRQFILYFALLIGSFSHLTLLWLYAFIQERQCLCLKTPGTVWLSNNCQYW